MDCRRNFLPKILTIFLICLTIPPNDEYDTLILVSGDGDYAQVLEKIRELGKQLENALPFTAGYYKYLLLYLDLFYLTCTVINYKIL